MAVKPLNSIAGFSTGDPALTIVQANGDVTTINFTANGISNLNAISNVRITGGTSGQVILTDGLGNLSFATIDTSIISNGTSNVAIPAVNGNVNTSVNGVANVLVVSGTGADVTGALGVTGNVTAGNVYANSGTIGASLLTGTLTTASQPNVTSVGTLTGLTVSGLTNLGNVGNVTITGGSSNQFLRTDGAGNLSFDDIGNLSSNRVAVMPYLIPTGEAYILNNNFQGLYSQPITIDGELTVDGMLIEIQDTTQSNPTEVLFNNTGTATGNTGFTFLKYNGNLNVPGNINASGSIIPGADDIYDLGNTTRRWRNGYFGGNTIYLDNASIAVDANGYVVITNSIGGQFIVEGNTTSGTNEIENGNSNVTVYANGNVATSVAGVANIFLVTSAGANLTGNLTTGGVKTDNLYYANGNPWDLGGNPGGSNTQIQFNDGSEFGGSANFTFDKVTNNLTISGNLVSTTGVIYGNAAGLTQIPGGNIVGNISGNISNAAHAGTANTVVNNAQPNITSVGTLTNLDVNGNTTVGGNLTVNGNLIYINVTELSIKDPIINLQTGANGAPPSSNSGKDVGSALNYYDTQARIAFMGWDTSNAEFAFGSQTTITNEVVTFDTLGNVRAQTFKGNIEANTIAGNLTTATQSNITTVGTLGSLSVTANITAGNVVGANTISANYLISNSGCVSVNGAYLAYDSGTGAAGIFSSLATDINFGLAANITAGSTTGTTTIRGNLVVDNNVWANTGTVKGSLLTGTLTTASQPNITSVGSLTNLTVTGNVSANNATANTVTTNSSISKRSNIAVTTDTVIDSFSISAYRTAKYVIKSENDNGYESLEVLLIHNNINSYVTVYAAINDGGGNTVAITTGISSGNVELRATGLAANTIVNCIGTYVPD
jgi:hypothetical protein